jgi:two-component system, chemotaxis family, chemotaxis protein CheY
MKILIADDSEIIREAVGEWITKFKFEISGKAENGKQALEMFKKLNPDIVTLDITMPEMDGLTAMEEMLKIKKETKIIIISALAAKETALAAIKKGAVSYLVKPFTRQELEEVFEEILEGK